MIITTTNSVEGYAIKEYKGIVFGEVITGIDMFKDIGAGFRNMFGGRSQGYEEELTQARQQAISELTQRATSMGANAVIGIDVDYEVLGTGGNMIMVSVTGTAVVI